MRKVDLRVALIAATLLADASSFAQGAPGDLPRVELGEKPEPFYSTNPNDPGTKSSISSSRVISPCAFRQISRKEHLSWIPRTEGESVPGYSKGTKPGY